ncbi:MAG TPA: hypothetical protein VK009_20675 [Chloroflexota bacterium]|nr:hypothetical protein [Chloroflexota bacterium]
MLGIAALISALLVTVCVATVVGRSEVGAGMAVATVQVARTTAHWPRPAGYPPAHMTVAGELELLTDEPARRWAWSADDLPQHAPPPAAPALLTPTITPALAAFAGPALQTAPVQPPSRFEVWDGAELWHG